ncbi:unnamed protein product [Arctia plantaginis]|uniref:Uncharacterized protein n=1 Tax=Arctia plantaginis TaxID=874455 RepID=A0A8S0ZFJ1_ARCPL|nr:unnamed protein product [Arctia plantaginis]
MKIFLVLLVLCVAEMHCGLVGNLIGRKDNNKPGLFTKVVQSLENGTTVIVDALGNIIAPNSRHEDANLKDGLPLVIDNVCVIEDDPSKCV